MASGDSKDKQLMESICGILFFGVPNQGMDLDPLALMLGNRPSQYLVQVLGKNSEVLLSQSNTFPRVFTSRDCRIVSFYETVRSPTARKVCVRISSPSSK